MGETRKGKKKRMERRKRARKAGDWREVEKGGRPSSGRKSEGHAVRDETGKNRQTDRRGPERQETHGRALAGPEEEGREEA